MYVIDLSKECLTTIRLTEAQRGFVNKESERQGVSVAEIIRRIIDDYRSPEKISVPLDGPEREYILELSKAIKDTPGMAIRMTLVMYRHIMQSPLAAILRPPAEVIDEIAEARASMRNP